MIRVSISCASGRGAATRRMGSSGKNTVPSGMAWTSPVNRQRARSSIRSRLNRPLASQPVQLGRAKARALEEAHHLLEPGRDQEVSARPAACRTKNSNTAVTVMPASR